MEWMHNSVKQVAKYEPQGFKLGVSPGFCLVSKGFENF